MLVVPKYGGRLFVSADDIHVMPLLVAYGVHEAGLTNWIMKNIKKGMRVIDAGAQFGYFTVLLAHLVGVEGHVDAFEPHPETAEILRMNMATNYVTEQVTIRELAVSDGNGQKVLIWSKGEESGASIHGLNHLLNKEPQQQKVTTVILDDVINKKVDFVKIDKEGNEYKVLRGARRTIRGGCIVAFELNKKVLGEDHARLFDLLGEYEQAGAKFSVPSLEGVLNPVDLEALIDVEFCSSVIMGVL